MTRATPGTPASYIINESKGLYYKTFNSCNLWIFEISQSVCSVAKKVYGFQKSLAG
jgi:hypothetical protein